ncbi:MAG: hypothetical protein M1827_004075 [Pycnora praestabilis]|nr:MAG: hypothetical protein M1827_004075 [Pycnora praestabilis]
MHFDNIPTTSGLAALPSPYQHLTFTPTFSILSPHDPALSNLISPNDYNVAVSSPNALLGSRGTTNAPDPGPAPSFRLDGKVAKKAHLEPWFSLLTFWIKPLDAPAPGTSIYVRGYRYNITTASTIDNATAPLEWSVTFPSGFHEPLLVKINEYSGDAWEGLEKVEIWAGFGVDELDWEFCVDDLDVRFFDAGDGEIDEEEGWVWVNGGTDRENDGQDVPAVVGDDMERELKF